MVLLINHKNNTQEAPKKATTSRAATIAPRGERTTITTILSVHDKQALYHSLHYTDLVELAL